MAQSLHRQLREERATLHRQALEIAEKPNATKEERARAHAMLDQADVMGRRIEQLEAPAMGSIRGGPVNSDVPVRGEDRAHRTAFDSYLRVGRAEMRAEDRQLLEREYRDLSTGGQSAGPGATAGFFVPTGFQYKIEEQMKLVGPMLVGGPGYPTIMDTENGAPMPFPTSDDTANTGEQIGENQQVTSQDVNLGQVLLGSFKYSSKLVKCSLELLQDSAFDLDSWLAREFGIRLARILNQKLTTGTGSTEPMGILTAAVNGGNLVAAKGSSTNDGTSASTNTVGSDDLVNLEHAIDPLYRSSARYMLHDTTLRSIKTIKDKYGRPLWQESTRDGQPATINGYQYLVNPYMDELQSSGPNSPPTVKKTVLFGAMEKYVIRRVRQIGVLRLVERFADYGQTAFLAFARYSGDSLDVAHRAFAVLENTF